MLMLEHDAKELLAAHGLTAPEASLATTARGVSPAFPPPWMVKAQIPAGGRGKSGGILRAETQEDLTFCLSALLGSRIKSHPVRECRIEQAVGSAREVYLSLSLDPRELCVRLLLSERGGVDIEAQGTQQLLVADAPPERAALVAAIEGLAEGLPRELRAPIREAGAKLAAAFLDLEAMLVEINPLFVRADGSWLAGDAKLILDDNALPRQDALRGLLHRRRSAYADAAFKHEHGFDFVVLDPHGEIGLVTTGAGLSMQLIDELVGLGARPFNFCDIRTGQMRGDPARLIHVLGQIAQGPNIRAILVNIFAGITDLAEFASLLVTAMNAVPELKAPVVARLVGHGEAAAAAILAASKLSLTIEPDLERAVALVSGSGDA